jgi:hypothetical protein
MEAFTDMRFNVLSGLAAVAGMTPLFENASFQARGLQQIKAFDVVAHHDKTLS